MERIRSWLGIWVGSPSTNWAIFISEPKRECCFMIDPTALISCRVTQLQFHGEQKEQKEKKKKKKEKKKKEKKKKEKKEKKPMKSSFIHSFFLPFILPSFFHSLSA